MSHPRQSRKKKKKPTPKKKKGWRTAATSDRHDLYEKSVQEPEADMDLVDQVWKELKGRKPVSIREDFCGTAAACMEWVRRHRDHTAIGVDLDQPVLDWGRAQMDERITPAQKKRLTLLNGDVLKVKTDPVDCVLAMNFSYYIFKSRPDLKRYFMAAFRALKAGGVLLLDAYGGSDSFLEMEEERDMDGFTYVWDQALYNPINGDVINHIHFVFPDGTKMKHAFTYEWRLWTLPEIRELLEEAGFRKVTTYWEGTDEETEEGNGEWTISTRGEACEGWVAYLVAEK